MKSAFNLSFLLVVVYTTCCVSTKKNIHATPSKLIARKFISRINTHRNNDGEKTTAKQRDVIQNSFLPSGLATGLGSDSINNIGINNLNEVTLNGATYGNSFHGDGDGVNQGFLGDGGDVAGFDGAGVQQQFDHRVEGPHPHVQLEQNIFKGRPQHVFDRNAQHVYNEHTRHVTPNREPLHIVQGKQIEITTKPQHVNVHFYQYDKQGKAGFTLVVWFLFVIVW